MPTFYRPIPGKSVPEFVNFTDELWAVASNQAALNYLDEQSDVKEQAVAKTLARGITPDNPEFSVTLANYGKEHWQRFGKTENRQGLGANTLTLNPGFSDLGQANAVGATPNLVFQGSTAEDFVATVPRTGPDQPATIIPNPAPPSEDAGGGSDDEVVVPPGGSDDEVVVPPGGDVVVPPGGGIMSEPVDLAPVTSLIGTPGAGQTGTQATLMGQTAGLATGQQGIRDVVDPLAGQVTTLQETVDPLASDIGTVKTDVGGIKTDVGTVKAGVGDVQSAIGTPAEGQTLFGGQQGIMSGIGTAGTGQTDLFKGQADLTAGQTGIQSAIGTADPEIEQPATLFEGQAGLAANQAGLMSGQRGITRDLTTEIGDVSSALGSQLGAFRTAAENYQRGATTQRGDIQGTQRANQANMLSQIQGVGQPINRQAEALANQRQQEAASFAASQAPLQQQIATLTANNANQAANNQPIGPLGPMAADPRDALIQQLLTRNASLMNNRPV